MKIQAIVTLIPYRFAQLQRFFSLTKKSVFFLFFSWDFTYFFRFCALLRSMWKARSRSGAQRDIVALPGGGVFKLQL